jgi:hypothetical protein
MAIDTPAHGTPIDPDAEDFDLAHAQLAALVEHPSVANVAGRFAAGLLTLRQFLGALFAIPEVAAAISTLDNGAGAIVGALVAGASGPLGPVDGPIAGALVTLALNALAAHIRNAPKS